MTTQTRVAGGYRPAQTMRAAPLRTVVVVPTYDERGNLPRFLDRFPHALADCLVVDDSSPDGTGALADELARERPWLHVLHRGEKAGLGAAYRAGFAWALERGYEAVGQMDADLQHPPETLPELLGKLQEGNDLVIASRFAPGGETGDWPRRRRLQSKLAILPARVLLGLPYADVTGGFKLWRASALRAIEVETTRSRGYVFQIETTWRARRAGLRIAEVGFTFGVRAEGESKLTGAVRWEGVRQVFALRREGWKPNA